MSRIGTTRKAVLFGALMLTVAAIFFPLDQGASIVPRHTVASPPVERAVASPAMYVASDEDEAAVDPFAPRGWLAAPQEAAVIAPVQPAAAVVQESVPTGPPPQPFRYAGRMNDGDEQIVYLARGEEAFIARVGDVLDSAYKVHSIDSVQVGLEHIPSGTRQSLTIPNQEN